MELLIYLILGIVGIFVIVFVAGFVMATLTSKKRLNSHAFGLFNQLSSNEKDIIRKVWFSFKKMTDKQANEATTNLSPLEVKHIERLFDPNIKPAKLSAGKTMDNATWLVYFNEAKDKGFNNVAAKIVAGVGLNGVEIFL